MTGKKNNQTGVIILAAGGSSRLGKPKQLLQFNEESLLHHAVKTAIATQPACTILVTGAFTDVDFSDKNEKEVLIVKNDQWQEGIASSIRCGIQALLQTDATIEGVLIMVCDQPYVSAELLQNLLQTWQETNKAIVACSYQDTVGTPCFFHRSLFNNLLKLTGDTGAKKLLNQFNDQVVTIPFPLGFIDIDTAYDYAQLLLNEQKK